MSDQLELEEQLRDEGRDRVEARHQDWISNARRHAIQVCAAAKSVSVVDLHQWAERTGNKPEDPLAYSAVFKGKEWVHTGEWRKSNHASAHARNVMVWKYVSTVY